MNNALQSALDSLRGAGARNVPETSVIENSPNGSKWFGTKRSGDKWYMVKHDADSYNVDC